MIHDLRYEVSRRIEKLQMKIAWALPKWLVMWATVRLFAHGTTGKWGNTEPSSLSIFDAMERWENDN